MNAKTPVRDDSIERLDHLTQLSRDVLAQAIALGASQAEVSLNEDRGLSVNVRLGEVETIEYTRDRGLGLTVYFGQSKGSASSADLEPDSLRATLEQACAIARHTEADPASGLAEAELMATEFPDFDHWHPRELLAEEAIALGQRCEQAGRGLDSRISNSEGASIGSNASVSVYANSHGFIGRERSTGYSVSCALIGGENEGMQRDYWYSSQSAFEDLDPVELVGRRAAERTLARMNPRSLATGEYPVMFSAEVARSLIGHLVGAVAGGALYRKASFLLDKVGEQLFPDWFDVVERPHLARGHRSGAYDSEGVATRDSDLIQGGVLTRYVLGSYSARKLGLRTTANAGGVHNLVVRANAGGLEDLMRGMGRGLLVTELMGQGVNAVTGDYSRGAAGFWIEDGQISYPVDGITIAGSLPSMFQAIEAVGSDVDRRSHVLTGSILVGRMTVAGEA